MVHGADGIISRRVRRGIAFEWPPGSGRKVLERTDVDIAPVLGFPGAMKRRHFLSLSVVLMSAFALASCGGGPWQIVRQAPGNPFGGAPVVQVLVDFRGLMLDTRRPIPEAEYLSTKTPE